LIASESIPLLAFSDDNLLFLIAMLSTLSVVLVIASVVAVQCRKARVAACNARLKQIMLERGMSAHEIAAVLNAGGAVDLAREVREAIAPEIRRAAAAAVEEGRSAKPDHQGAGKCAYPPCR
jgi:hypothetical protein